MLISVKPFVKGTDCNERPILPRIGLENSADANLMAYADTELGDVLLNSNKEFSWRSVSNIINDHLRRIPHETS